MFLGCRGYAGFKPEAQLHVERHPGTTCFFGLYVSDPKLQHDEVLRNS